MGYHIVFQPSGIRCEDGTSSETLLQIAQRLGVDIHAACGGNKTCGKCRIKIVSGEPENVTNIADEERRILSDNEINSGVRLACMTYPCGDIVVEILRKSQLSEQVVLINGKCRSVPLNAAVKTYAVTLPRALLYDYRDDLTRLCDALHDINPNLSKNLEIAYPVLRQLSKTIRQGHWTVTAVIWKDRRIIGIRSGKNLNCYGTAIDIGTTTVAAYLCDLNTGETLQTASMVNPQVMFGDDVLARISYCMLENDGLYKLNKLLIDSLNNLILEMSSKHGISAEDIVEYVIAGNTVMQHIALNLSPDYIGVSPFVSAVHDPVDVYAHELGLFGMTCANVHFLPGAAGFIGADHIAVLLAEEPYKQDKISLTIDIGTNSEICLCSRDKMYVTSCASGPALEGAQIKCGMRAAYGAVEKVLIDSESLEPELSIIGNAAIPLGICGSGIIDAVSQMKKTGILEENGKFARNLKSNRIRNDKNGRPEYVLYYAKNSNDHDIVVTAKDIRAVQLAKAALYTGAKILMQRMNVDNIDEVILAGAFGSYLDKSSVLQLGMFPDCEIEQIHVSGNAAGVGARYALINIDKRQEAVWIAANLTFEETAADSQFQNMFADAMWIPHKTYKFHY